MPGETVVVSAASGAVGTVVGQLAGKAGCRTVGVAGRPEKCRFVVEELGFDACLDHKAGDLGAGQERAAPDGVNAYFDNVGGRVLDAVMARMNAFGRIAACGDARSAITGITLSAGFASTVGWPASAL